MMNDNAEFLSTICLDNKLVGLNYLITQDKHSVSSKTHRKRNAWVSEIDTCVVSPKLLEYVHEFVFIKRANMPSDHAPICVTMSSPGTHMDNVLARAALLRDHTALYGSVAKCNVTKNPSNLQT